GTSTRWCRRTSAGSATRSSSCRKASRYTSCPASCASSWPRTTARRWPRKERTDMATHIVPYKFDDFIGDLELITSVGSTDEDKIRLIQRKLRLLIATGNFLPSEAKTPALQRYARHLVHEDPKKRFIVVSLVWT